MDELLRDATNRAIRYLDTLPARRVSPSLSALEGLGGFARPFPDRPLSPAKVLEELDTIGSPAAVARAGGRFFGFVIGGCLPAALAANILAAAWDQNAVLELTSPVAAALEKVCRNWIADLFDLPAEVEVGFVTSATMANFTGLAAARHALLLAQGWDVEAKGLFGAPPITVIVGDEVHVSLLKALSMLGLGRDRVVRVGADGQGRIIPEQIPPIQGPTIVCLQAGNVNTGAFDPLDEVASRLHGTPAWVHIDGAFGLWAAASPSRRHLLHAVDTADSWATDAHKWLNVRQRLGRRPEQAPPERRYVLQRRISRRRPDQRPSPFRAGDVSAGSRDRNLGGPSRAWQSGSRRSHRSLVRSRKAFCRSAKTRRPPSVERGCDQPSTRIVWCPRDHPSGDRPRPAGRDVLVWRDSMAGQYCDEDQRLIMGYRS